MTLAATVASEAVARGIEEAGPEQGGGVFMHGPTFMGNPLACAVGCASLDLLNASPWAERVEGIRGALRKGFRRAGNSGGSATCGHSAQSASWRWTSP